MKKQYPRFAAVFLVLISALCGLNSCRIFGDSFSITRYYRVTSAGSEATFSADELLLLTEKAIESDQYECSLQGHDFAFPFKCDHPHNELVVVYRLEDGSVLYNMFSLFVWDARNAVERFEAGANSLQARFLEEDLRSTQIYP